MKLLFDTHTFIWWDSEPTKLSQRALDLLTDTTHIKIISVVTIWEMQIKYQLGKLNLTMPLSNIIQEQINRNNLQILPIVMDHILELNNLPLYHRDPFDRLLIAQANIENAVLISCDSVFANYSVRVEW